MIVTPGQLTKRAEFYYQLNQLTAAGIGLVAGLHQLQQTGRTYREPIQQVLQRLAEGQTFAQALRATPNWLPAFDITLIEAGEKSGRLDQSFRMLATYYSDRATTAKRMIAALAYPVFLMHFAVFIFPFPHFFLTGDLRAYLLQTLGILVPIYALVFGLIYVMQSKHGETWRAWIETVLHPIPVLGPARRYLALSRLAAALEALLSSGVTIVESWEMAAAASGSPAVRRTVGKWKPLLAAGQTPAEIIQDSKWFPDLFTTQYATGEVSGSLDDGLRRLHDYYRQEGSRKLDSVARWTPTAIYLVIVLVIAYKILSFWLGYFQQIQSAIS